MRRLLIGGAALLALVLLYSSLRQIDWRSVAQIVAHIRPPYALTAAAMGLLALLLRAARWRVLLRQQAPVSLTCTFWALAAGYFGNNFLPARAGEVLRSHIIAERSDLPTGFVLATALSEHIADAVALVVLGGLASLFTGSSLLACGSFAMVGIIGIVALVCAPLCERWFARFLDPWPRVKKIAQQAIMGVRSLHSWQTLPAFVLMTAVIWMIDAIATSTLALSLSIKLPVPVALLLLVGLGLSSALPTTPGNIGVYQFVAVIALKPFGISSEKAMAFSLIMQAFSYLQTSFLGFIALSWFTPIDWRLVGRPPTPQLAVQPSQIQS